MRGLRLFIFFLRGRIQNVENIEKKEIASIHITITDNHPLLTVAFYFHFIVRKNNACLL